MFARNGEALQQTQRDQQHGRSDTDLLISGQHADHEGGQPHQQQREAQHLTTPIDIADVTEQQRAYRARDIARTNRGDCRQRRQTRFSAREV